MAYPKSQLFIASGTSAEAHAHVPTYLNLQLNETNLTVYQPRVTEVLMNVATF